MNSKGEPKRHVSILSNSGFLVDGIAQPFIAAQFDYFRHDAMYWERILDAIEGAEINIISTFIAWEFHELGVGDFDFEGRTHSSRNLVRFLEICNARKLKVLARPGPFIDAEWETRGPAWDVATLDRLHPKFLKRTAQWLAAVDAVLAPAQISQSGPVIALGIDNEIVYPWCTSLETFRSEGDIMLPYDKEYHDGLFRSWLKLQYESIEQLNKTHGTEYATWDEVESPRFNEDPVSMAQEAFTFSNCHTIEYVNKIKEMHIQNGIDLPMYTNQFQHLGHVEWSKVGLDGVGVNLFTPNNMPGSQALIANWWLRLHFARFNYRFSSEFQCGWIGLDEAYGFLTPEHTEYAPMAAQALGLRGLNFFVFAEREDWSHSPVNSRGKIRADRYEAVQRVVRSYKALAPVDTQLADIGLIWGAHDHVASYLETDVNWSTISNHADTVGSPAEPCTWWQTFVGLVESDLDFRIWIPGVSPGKAPKVLVHAGLNFAPVKHIAALVTAVAKAGCRLIEVTPLPGCDLSGMATQELTEILEKIPQHLRVKSSIADLPLTTRYCGAKRYAYSERKDVWSHVFRDESGVVVLGIWNSGAEYYDGIITLAETCLPGQTECYWIDEPSTGDVRELARKDVLQLKVSLKPHSARVFRINPA